MHLTHVKHLYFFKDKDFVLIFYNFRFSNTWYWEQPLSIGQCVCLCVSVCVRARQTTRRGDRPTKWNWLGKILKRVWLCRVNMMEKNKPREPHTHTWLITVQKPVSRAIYITRHTCKTSQLIRNAGSDSSETLKLRAVTKARPLSPVRWPQWPGLSPWWLQTSGSQRGALRCSEWRRTGQHRGQQTAPLMCRCPGRCRWKTLSCWRAGWAARAHTV